MLLFLREEEVYGYELIQKLRQAGFTDIIGGTVYPILKKLESKGLAAGIKKPSPDGPDRKYYHLTEQGQQQCNEFIENWNELDLIVNQLIKGVEQHEKTSYLND